MATKDSYMKALEEEFRQFRTRWDEIYNTGTEKDIATRIDIDATHPPALLRRIMDDLIAECMANVNELLATEFGEILDSKEMYERTTNYILGWCKLTGIRMYRMGQSLVHVLPYDRLTPCPCQTVFDEELDTFLKESVKVIQEGHRQIKFEGDGWVVYYEGR